MQPLGKCKVVNVRPGWIDTNFIRNVKSTIPKDIEILTPNQVADTVIYIINQPKNVCIKSISIEINENFEEQYKIALQILKKSNFYFKN